MLHEYTNFYLPGKATLAPACPLRRRAPLPGAVGFHSSSDGRSRRQQRKCRSTQRQRPAAFATPPPRGLFGGYRQSTHSPLTKYYRLCFFPPALLLSPTGNLGERARKNKTTWRLSSTTTVQDYTGCRRAVLYVSRKIYSSSSWISFGSSLAASRSISLGSSLPVSTSPAPPPPASIPAEAEPPPPSPLPLDFHPGQGIVTTWSRPRRDRSSSV